MNFRECREFVASKLGGRSKGQLTEHGIAIASMLLFVGIFAGAAALALSGMLATTSNANAQAALGNASSGVVSLTQQLPTVGVIGGIGLILIVLAIAFQYFRGRQ